MKKYKQFENDLTYHLKYNWELHSDIKQQFPTSNDSNTIILIKNEINPQSWILGSLNGLLKEAYSDLIASGIATAKETRKLFGLP